MTKVLSLPLLIDCISQSGHTAFRVLVPRNCTEEWCLGLMLLSSDLVDSVVIRYSDRGNELEVRKGLESTVSLDDPKRPTVRLSRTDLEFVVHFFLRYYRDGVAEVDHIDLETQGGDYLTIKVEDFACPVDAAEARRRLS